MKCKQCKYFEKVKDIKECKPGEVNGICHLVPPQIIIFNGRIVSSMPVVSEDNLICKEFIKKGK